jgi:hypothetical protein
MCKKYLKMKKIPINNPLPLPQKVLNPQQKKVMLQYIYELVHCNWFTGKEGFSLVQYTPQHFFATPFGLSRNLCPREPLVQETPPLILPLFFVPSRLLGKEVPPQLTSLGTEQKVTEL